MVVSVELLRRLVTARKLVRVVVYAPRGAARHIISMTKANDREKTRIEPLLGI